MCDGKAVENREAIVTGSPPHRNSTISSDDKMGSMSLDYQSRLMALTEKMYFTPILLGPRKKAKRRHDLELANRSKTRPEDACHSQRVITWLKTLPLASRIQVVCDKNPWLSAILRQMFVRKVKEGDGLFTLCQEQGRPCESTALDDNFKFRRLNSDSGLTLRISSFFSAERLLEQQLRFTDSQEYLDTITVAPEVLTDIDKFLRTLSDVSEERAFATPCRVSWDSVAKVWLWETPLWNSEVDQPLVVWAASCIERSIWMRYWEAMKLDPRVPGETQSFSWEPQSEDGYLSNRVTLIDHWKEQDSSQRSAITSSLQDLQALFQIEKQNWVKAPALQYGYPQPSFSTLTNSSIYNSFSCNLMGFFGSPAGTYYSACRARMQCFQNSKSMETVLKTAQESACEFVDFLFLSPLERAGSIMDAVTRVLAGRLNASYQQKLADELIASESQVKTKRSQKRQPCKAPRRKSSDVSTSSTAQGHSTEDDEDTNAFISLIVSNLVENLSFPVHAQADDEGFQVVSSRKKQKPAKTAPPPASPKKNKGKGKRGKKQVIPPLRSPPQKQIPGKAIFWEETAVTAIVPPAEGQFPPLNHSREVPQELSQLHREIEDFERCMLATSDRKLESRLLLLEKLREIAAGSFPGAEVELFGSYATRLALPSSDMDVVVLYPFLESREHVQFAVRTLAEILQDFPWTISALAIDSATVPLVKLQVNAQLFAGVDADSIRVDVSFDGLRGSSLTAHIGLDSAAFVQELLASQPRLRGIILVLKQLLALNDLNCAYTGGISSYALVLWTAARLSAEATSDTGLLLQTFLQFFGTEFNPKSTGINLTLGRK